MKQNVVPSVSVISVFGIQNNGKCHAMISPLFAQMTNYPGSTCSSTLPHLPHTIQSMPATPFQSTSTLSPTVSQASSPSLRRFCHPWFVVSPDALARLLWPFEDCELDLRGRCLEERHSFEQRRDCRSLGGLLG